MISVLSASNNLIYEGSTVIDKNNMIYELSSISKNTYYTRYIGQISKNGRIVLERPKKTLRIMNLTSSIKIQEYRRFSI